MPKLKVAKIWMLPIKSDLYISCQLKVLMNWIESSQFWKLKVCSAFLAKLPNCQVAKLPNCQVAKLPSCQIAKLQVAKLWTCDHGAKSLSFLFYYQILKAT